MPEGKRGVTGGEGAGEDKYEELVAGIVEVAQGAGVDVHCGGILNENSRYQSEVAIQLFSHPQPKW